MNSLVFVSRRAFCKKHLKTAWVARNSQQTTEKPWGHEESWSGFNGIHGKILFIDKGKKTSLKFNNLKRKRIEKYSIYFIKYLIYKPKVISLFNSQFFFIF